MTAGASRLKALMETARDGAPDARRTLLRAVTDIFLEQSGRFSPAETRHFDAIFSMLTREAAPALRCGAPQRPKAQPATATRTRLRMVQRSASGVNPCFSTI